jgi:hypothetical protein
MGTLLVRFVLSRWQRLQRQRLMPIVCSHLLHVLFSVVANGFIIREVEQHNPEHFLHSPNIFEVGQSLLHLTPTVGVAKVKLI